MKDYYEQTVKGVKFWTGDMEVEHSALNQLRNIAQLPILAGHVSVMPDVHMGMGATVGSVIPTRGAIIPSAIGVDIGCGMAAVQLSLRAEDLPESLTEVRLAVESSIPVGFSAHDDFDRMIKHPDVHYQTRDQIIKHLKAFDDLKIFGRIKKFDEKRMTRQVGTLGGGNHFIEVCLDEANNVWLMLHSGSRNVGKTVGEFAVEMAKLHAKEMGYGLPDRDLAWLDEGTPQFEEYVEAMLWCQDYAKFNREVMLQLTLGALARSIGKPFTIINKAINCHHNYASRENHFGQDMFITRKGAVSAREGQLGIIPGSMGAKSFIVRGKGLAESYCSCSHGAGRKHSRGAAKRLFTVEDLKVQTAGVECRKDDGVLDEIPGAYKDIEAVMAAQAELVEVVHVLKQIMCVKG